MAVPSQDEVITEFSDRVTRFTNSPAMINWFNEEVKANYEFDAGLQWTQSDYSKQQELRFPAYVINKSTPIIDSITGFQIQNRSKAKYQARMLSLEGFKDVVSNTVAYIESDSNASFENSQSFRDMLICGVGATETYIDYDNNEDGDVVVDRIFPGFLMWDVGARAKNLKDSDWIARAQLITDSAAKGLLDEYGEEDDEMPTYNTSSTIAGIGAGWFMQFWDTFAYKGMRLNLLYHYQWRKKEPFYRVANPFFEMDVEAIPPVILNYMAALKDNYNQDVAEPIFNMSYAEYRKFKKDMDAFGIELNKKRRSRYKYYRATILGSKVLEIKELFTQKGFSIKAMTGRYDESRQMYFGIMRPLKSPQRLFNQAISDLQGLIHSSPLSGVIVEEDAVDNMRDFVDTYARAKDVTIVKAGALQSGKVQQKNGPSTPPALADMINIAETAMLQVAGINREFLGIMDSPDMAAALQKQRVRQALTTLAIFFDAMKFYIIEQGKMFVDCVRLLADIAPGRLIRNVTGEGSQKYFPLLQDGIAAEYDIIVEDVPQTPQEQNEMFMQLMNIAASMQNPALYNVAIEFADIPKETKDKIAQAMTPPPPAPPDPLQVQLLDSQSKKDYAEAEYKQAQAKQIDLQTMLKYKELQAKDSFDEAELQKVRSETLVNVSKATKVN